MASKERSFAVIGLGNFGSTVACELTGFGNYVIGIDRDKKPVADFSADISQTIIADSRDEAALREAGIGQCDVALIAMGEDLESSVLTAINLKVIGIEQVWAKAANRTHHRVLSRLGVDRVVKPEEEMGFHVAQRMHNPIVHDYVSVGNGLYVVNVKLPESLNGKSLEDLDLAGRFDLRCIGLMRGSEFVGSSESPCGMEEGDRLLLLGKRQDLREFASSL